MKKIESRYPRKLEQYEIIDGKPYGGHFYGTYVFSMNIEKESLDDPGYAEAIGRLNYWKEENFSGFEIRNNQYIYKASRKECHFGVSINQMSRLAVKFIVWGRAYKVQRIVKGSVKSYKKVYVSGRRKRKLIKRCV